MLRTIVFNAALSSKDDAELIDFLEELYLNWDNIDNFISERKTEKTPNELLKEIFFTVDQLRYKLENGEDFVNPEILAQLEFYKRKAEGDSDESE